MKSFSPLILCILTAFMALASCDSETGEIGQIIMPSQDSLSTFTQPFTIETRTVKTGPIEARSNTCLLGNFVDPETRAMTTCSYLAQFHLLEDYNLPSKDRLVLDENGDVKVDSCILKILFYKYYGDTLTTMKVNITDLDPRHPLEENETYYTDINAADYVNPTPHINKTVSYSVLDLNRTASGAIDHGYYLTLPISLGSEYGSYLLNTYFKHPEYYQNSYTFIRNICPGFYIQHAGGVGSLINSDVSTIDISFNFRKNDTTLVASSLRLAATQEVIQTTRYDQEIPEDMMKEDLPYTYIKTPAALHTEVRIPISEIASGQHSKDTINSARFTLRRYVDSNKDNNALTPPKNLLLIRKGKAEEFFKKNSLPDDLTSVLCSYNSKENAYTFSNIATMISAITRERDNAAGILATDSQETRQAKWDALAAKDPYWSEEGDWQKFDLIGVNAYYTTTESYYGSYQTLVGVYNDYDLHSVKLESGSDSETQLHVIYSRFKM